MLDPVDIDDEYLVVDVHGIKHGANSIEHIADILCLVERGNDERQRFAVKRARLILRPAFRIP